MNDTTLLFVDDHDILYCAGLKRAVHPLTRHAHNPLLPGRDRPWEVAIGWCCVYHDPASGRYQLWYQAFAGHEAQERTHRCVVCYAQSDDGIQWRKPDLGLYAFNDVPNTNIVLLANGGYSDRYSNAVVVDPHDPDPTRRYKMAYFDFAYEQGQEHPGLSVAFSPDGIHWRKHPQAPLLKASYGDLGDPVPFTNETHRPWAQPLSFSDAMDAFYDPRRQVFVIYHKMWLDGPMGAMYWKHGMGRTQSADFITWTRPQLLLTPDEFDPTWVEFHHSPVFYYNDCYFALLQILNRGERGGVMDCELAISRDGIQWQRPFRQPFFLPRSEGDQFDGGSILSNGSPVLLANEFRFYYGGYSQGATGADDYGLTTGIGLAIMLRDRFVALRPMDHQGQLTLKPLDVTGCSAFTVNANAQGGQIRVELLDGEGRRIPGFSRDEAVPITGDGLRQPVAWRNATLAEAPAGLVMPRIYLERAEVFALTLCL